MHSIYVSSTIRFDIYDMSDRNPVSLDLAILGFLAERPRTGYDLKTQCFGGPLSAFWTADQAQIYRTLERLRAEKLVTVTRRRQASRPDRKVYEITDAGFEALRRGLSVTEPLPPLRDPFLIQLYFSARLDDEDLLSLLYARQAEYRARLTAIANRSAELGEAEDFPAREAVLRHTALDGAAAAYRATIEWLDDCIRAVEEGALPGSERGTGQRHLFGT